MTPGVRWAIQWRSRSKLFGDESCFMWDGERPLLFPTRSRARKYIEQRYGYIRQRPDLRREPHGWKMPRPVQVQVILRAIKRVASR